MTDTISIPREFLWALGRREELTEQAEKFLDEHENENGELTLADAKEYRRFKREIDQLTFEINAELKKPDPESEKNWRACLPNPKSQPLPDFFAGSYRNQFISAVRKNFRGVENNLHEGTDASGGYLLPVEMDSQIVSTLAEENILRKIGKTITTASEHKITLVVNKPTANWIAEGQAITLSNEQFGSVSLNAYKLAVGLKVTNELLADSAYDLEKHLSDEFGKALALAEEDAFLNGNQPTEPKGLLTQMAESATSFIQTNGAAITADDLLTLQYSMRRPYRKSSCWLMNDATLAVIRKLKDNTQNYIWEPSLVNDEPPKLFGQPVYTSQFMPQATAGNVAVLYGDFANYFVIGDRGNRTFQPLRELYALNDQSAFLMIERVDCALTNSEAIRGLKIRQS